MTATTEFQGLPAVPAQDPSLNAPPGEAVQRKIRTVVPAIDKAEGQGARSRRSIGTSNLRNLSPFLLLDHFDIPPEAGFPDHPHRGFETVTYVLSGGVDHEDFNGGRGTIFTGDLQFMTAGRGLMHAEMPRFTDSEGNKVSSVTGMQLWVDLPKSLKSCEPRYRDLRASEIPDLSLDNDKVTVKVISGRSHGIDSVQELAYTPVWLLDIKIKPGGSITQNLPVSWNAFAYLLAGNARFGSDPHSQTVEQYHNVVFEQEGDAVTAAVDSNATEDAHIILVAGMPLDQPVVQYGPFALNSVEEVKQAMLDFSTNTNGFERALNWQSEIGKSMVW